ncbi:hypothetical protein [Vibrio maerlii]|uniref:hypothetical protein n=1 Tax=Vibrio maerlii TaxID=2231648 RepID=UPI001F128F68|nr:hypothetical protein [Vibrio maerlii]
MTLQAKISTCVQLILAASIVYLGSSIYQISQKITDVIDVYPQVLSDASEVTKELQIEDWIEFTNQLEVFVPQIIATVDKVQMTAADIEKTAASIDSKIPSIVTEVYAIRSETIPSVLTEVEAVRRQSVPAVLKEASLYRKNVIPPVLTESKGYREQTIPVIIKESEQLRQELPPMLAKADEIVDNSKDIMQQATIGAVEGTVKGVVLTPVNLLKDAGQNVKSRIVTEEE